MSYTLLERYYGINRALNEYLVSRSITCPILKYGIDAAALKTATKSQIVKYPYMQSYLMNPRPAAWTSEESGIMTEFEYQLNFYTAPTDEFSNDAGLYTPFEVAKNALSDVNARVLAIPGYAGGETTWADLLDIKHSYDFAMKSGNPVPAAFMIARFRAVCAYAKDVPEAGPTTDLDDAITINEVNS